MGGTVRGFPSPAERCPTGAWDMQKFRLDTTQAGPGCRDAQITLHTLEAA